jgi:hypothetical protein
MKKELRKMDFIENILLDLLTEAGATEKQARWLLKWYLEEAESEKRNDFAERKAAMISMDS